MRLHLNHLEIDLNANQVLRDGQRVKLTGHEWGVLRELALHRGQVLTYRTLLQRVWGDAYGDETDYVHTYIRKLRRKVEDDPANPALILTESGIGYRLVMPDDVPAADAENAPNGIAAIATRRAVLINPLPQEIGARFVGRATELGELREWFAQNARLISLYGRGGVGKTALACRAIADQIDNFDGIVSLSAGGTAVTLARILDDFLKLLSGNAAAALDQAIRDTRLPATQKVTALLDQLGSGRYLFFLDNAESLQNQATGRFEDSELETFFRQTIERGSGLALLITSRERLALPLSAKTWERVIALEEGLASADAVQLLRLCDSNNDAGLRDAPSSLLMRIAEKTRGVPRSLEVTVGLLLSDPLLTPTHLLADDALFTSEISSVFIQSILERLSAEAIRVMESLAVLGQPATEEAIAALLVDAPQLHERLHERLTQLVRCYFCHYSRADQTFALHPIDQAYCYERLTPAERIALHRRAADYFELVESEPASQWESFEAIQPYLTACVHRAKAGDYERAMQMIATIDAPYLSRWGYETELIALYELLRGHITTPDYLLRLGNAYRAVGRAQEALDYYKQSGLTTGLCLENIGWALYDLGQFSAAEDRWQAALRAFNTQADAAGAARVIGGLGWIAFLNGEDGRAQTLFEDAVQRFSAMGDAYGRGVNLGDLANVYTARGDYAQAIPLLRESLAIAESRADNRELSYKSIYLAKALLWANDLDAAEIAISRAKAANTIAARHTTLALYGLILWRRGKAADARELFREAIESANGLIGLGLYTARYARALAYAAVGDVDAAIEDYGAAKAICSAAGVAADNLHLLDTLRTLAESSVLDAVHDVLR